jgi:hypothetical protein
VRVSVEDGGQRHVDQVAALALLILHHGSQCRRSGSLPTRHGKAQDHQTQNRCSNQFEPFVVFHIGFLIFCVVLNRLVESVRKDNRLFRSSWMVQIDASYDGKRFIVCADEKLTAFRQIESATRRATAL